MRITIESVAGKSFVDVTGNTKYLELKYKIAYKFGIDANNL